MKPNHKQKLILCFLIFFIGEYILLFTEACIWIGFLISAIGIGLISSIPFYSTRKKKYRVGKKQKRAILEVATGHEFLIFPVGKEKECVEYCEFLNNQSKYY